MAKMHPHESSVTSHHGYDEKSQEIHLTFHSGETHAYQLSPEDYQRFLKAPSKGRYFNANLKNQPFRKV